MNLRQIIDKVQALQQELDHRDPYPRAAASEVRCALGHLQHARSLLARDEVPELDIAF